MRALIIQHEESTPPGSTIEWLDQRKIPFTQLFPHDFFNFETYDAYDLVIVCGGGMHVDQEDLYPWLKKEKEILLNFIRKNKKIVGLCLGGQLLAELMGGKVEPLPHWEVGWWPVDLAEGKSLTVFHWHAYGFTLPKKAKVIASNLACPIQGFTYDDRIIAVQFHPETTIEWAIECANHPRIPTINKYVQSPEEIKRDVTYQNKMQEWYFSQLDLLVGNIR
jgi:GMP synthase-like glutamine amidotransferase